MFQNTLSPPPKSPSQLTFLFKPNATMNYHDSQGRNNITLLSNLLSRAVVLRPIYCSLKRKTQKKTATTLAYPNIAFTFRWCCTRLSAYMAFTFRWYCTWLSAYRNRARIRICRNFFP